METFYSTGAQLVPVLLIVLAVDLGRGTVETRHLKRVLLVAGGVELACLVGLFLTAIPRPGWLPTALPWVGASLTFVSLAGLVAYTCVSLFWFRLGQDVDHYTEEAALQDIIAGARAAGMARPMKSPFATPGERDSTNPGPDGSSVD